MADVFAPSAGSGLNVAIAPGSVLLNGIIFSYGGGTVALADAILNRVYLDPVTPAFKSKIGAWAPTDLPIAEVRTTANGCETVTDLRALDVGAGRVDRLTTATAGSTNFGENEEVSGSGTSWVLDHAPISGDSVQLLQDDPDFGLVGLKKVDTLANAQDFTINGRNITTFTSFPPGGLRAWYRY